MSYAAIVTPLANVRKHPNADRLQLASCWGDQVIVGLQQKEGDVGLYFPTDGQLSDEFCTANDLYSKSALQQLGRPDTGQYGFFDAHRRVRAQSFRGEKSEGFWLPLPQALSYADGPALTVGEKLTEWGQAPLCNKYITKKTLRLSAAGPRARGRKGELCGFPKHYDTDQFRYEWENIPIGSLVYLTEKLHGTSHRFGLVGHKVKPKWWQRLLGWPATRTEYQMEHGSRNVILQPEKESGYYGSDQFRYNALAGILPRKGEVLFGELVGFYDVGQPIMPKVSVPKELTDIYSAYGPTITYSYGCAAAAAECRFYLYRVVQFNEDGQGVELSWPQVQRRAMELRVPCVPSLQQSAWDTLTLSDFDNAHEAPLVIHSGESLQMLKEAVESLVDGSSLLDPTHLREGVCVRVDTPAGRTYTLKHKSFAFKVLEGIVKLNDEISDMEEAA